MLVYSSFRAYVSTATDKIRETTRRANIYALPDTVPLSRSMVTEETPDAREKVNEAYLTEASIRQKAQKNALKEQMLAEGKTADEI